jgi:hypothetical protein
MVKSKKWSILVRTSQWRLLEPVHGGEVSESHGPVAKPAYATALARDDRVGIDR